MVDKRINAKPILHPEFGRKLDKWMEDGPVKFSNAEIGKELGFKTGEMVRRYRLGETMPKKDRLAKLAKLMHLTPAELRGEPSPQVLAGMLGDAMDLSEDEQRLIKAYRLMNSTGRKAIRSHASQLLEMQGVKGPDNPYGKARLN